MPEERDEIAKMSAFDVKNYMGIKSVATIHWKKERAGGSVRFELTAEQCMDLSMRLLDQAKILMLERPSAKQ